MKELGRGGDLMYSVGHPGCQKWKSWSITVAIARVVARGQRRKCLLVKHSLGFRNPHDLLVVLMEQKPDPKECHMRPKFLLILAAAIVMASPAVPPLELGEGSLHPPPEP